MGGVGGFAWVSRSVGLCDRLKSELLTQTSRFTLYMQEALRYVHINVDYR